MSRFFGNDSTEHLANIFQQAKISHGFFHQNVPALVQMFKKSWDQVRTIVTTCPSVQSKPLPSIRGWVNPQGLQNRQLWQTDMTHYASFGKQKVHSHICRYVLRSSLCLRTLRWKSQRYDMLAFSTLGVPKEIKTDNGPVYTSKQFQQFLDQWGVQKVTSISHNPTRQSIIKRAHHSINHILYQ